MRRRMGIMTAALLVAALAGVAGANNQRELTRDELKAEAAQNKALARYIRLYGTPDAAEWHSLGDQPPWDDHEVILYYVEMRKEISFSRARILGQPEVCQQRYEHTLTDGDIQALKNRVTLASTEPTSGVAVAACTGSAVARAECSAGRAEDAAARVDAAAGRAEKAAGRTEAVVAKMQAPAPHAKKAKQRTAKEKAAPKAG
jgi:hypothetical protein